MKFLASLVVGLSLLLVPAFAFAQTDVVYPAGGSTGVTYPAGGSTGGASSQTITNPLGVSSFCGLIKALLQAVIAIGIPIAVLFIVFAGFKFIIARGNPGKLDEAKKNLVYTFIGIGIFLGAWLLAMVIANTVNALGSGSGQTQIINCR